MPASAVLVGFDAISRKVPDIQTSSLLSFKTYRAEHFAWYFEFVALKRGPLCAKFRAPNISKKP